MLSPKMLEAGWRQLLSAEFEASYFQNIKAALDQCYECKQLVYPEKDQIFKAFELCPFHQTRVVILGQDPYHGAGQAHGLSFSVPKGIKPPPSLVNIFKEIASDLKVSPPQHGNLEAWARQGVLLLNSILTVEANKAASHRKLGWEKFTDAAICALNKQKKGVVFLLWGNFAIKKSQLIDAEKHLVLIAPHPSPLSAYQGWHGCKHFSLTNKWLINQGQPAIQWV